MYTVIHTKVFVNSHHVRRKLSTNRTVKSFFFFYQIFYIIYYVNSSVYIIPNGLLKYYLSSTPRVQYKIRNIITRNNSQGYKILNENTLRENSIISGVEVEDV